MSPHTGFTKCVCTLLCKSSVLFEVSAFIFPAKLPSGTMPAAGLPVVAMFQGFSCGCAVTVIILTDFCGVCKEKGLEGRHRWDSLCSELT